MKLVVILLFVTFATMFAVIYLGGCYDAHAAEPCDASWPEAQVDEHRIPNPDDAGSRPVWSADPCAGPIVAGECYADLEDWLSR